MKKSSSSIVYESPPEIINTFEKLKYNILKESSKLGLKSENISIKIENFIVKVSYKTNNLIFNLPVVSYAHNIGTNSSFRYKIKHFAGNYKEAFQFLNFIEDNIYYLDQSNIENPINLGDLLNYYPKYIKSLKQIPKIKTKNDIKQIVLQFSI